jgi:hypothetical protein
MCDLVLSQDQRLLAFRMTARPDWLYNNLHEEAEGVSVEGSEHAQRAHTDVLEIVSDEEILVTSSARAWPVVQLLEEFAEIAGINNGRLRYHLTPKALGEALSRGRRPDALLDLLRHSAAHEQQHNSFLTRMIARLEGWIANYGRARIYTGVSLLEVVDITVMRELSATTSLDEQVVRTIHPTLLIVKKPGAERIIEELKRRGQTPLLHEEERYGAE